MLEIAELTVGLDVIAQRRTSRRNGLGQNRPDRRNQALRPSPADRAGEPTRRQPRPEQCLTDVDITEAGNDPLIEQRRFDRRQLAGELGSEIGAVEAGFERFWPEPDEQRMLVFLAALDVIECPKPARVVKADNGSVV